MKTFPCDDGCGKAMPRKGDRCPACIRAFNKKVNAAMKAKGPIAGYIFQISYHVARYSFATVYAQVPGKDFKKAMQRAQKARRELDYFDQLGIPDVDIRLGSIFYLSELHNEKKGV